MPDTRQTTEAAASSTNADNVHARLADLIIRKCRADDARRRGICLLNARRFDEALAAFDAAQNEGVQDAQLDALLGAAHLGRHDLQAAQAHFTSASADPATAMANAIRRAHALVEDDRAMQAVDVLRGAIRQCPDCAELHFQLGTLLAARNQLEEAKLRFTQALSIDREHAEAHLSLALICGAQNEAKRAVDLLRRAQSLRPDDARVAALLTVALRAATQQGRNVEVSATIDGPGNGLPERWVQQLAAVVETNPDFVDAFLSLPDGMTETRVYESLLRTLQHALEHRPQQAELHYHCGRVLDRLGQRSEAIQHNERAVALDPHCARALIELANLYEKTDRKADATSRLEQAVRVGADYPDVHFLLGNLYRDQGLVLKAKNAYRSALALNERYEKARHALSALTA